MDYSTSELQQMTIDQEKQIEDNQRLISQREQRLKYLHIPKMEHRKYLFIQTLLQQINGNRGNEVEILKQIFFDKERQLIFLSNKLDQLRTQLHQLQISEMSNKNDQSEPIQLNDRIDKNIVRLTNSFSLDSLKEQLTPDEENLSIWSNSNDLSMDYLIPQTIEVRDELFEETKIESFISDSGSDDSLHEDLESIISFSPIPAMNLKSLLKNSTISSDSSRRVTFDPLALLLDAATRGDYDLLVQSAKEVINPSEPNDEGLTALHNAVCASNFDCVKYLVEFGCDINYPDNDGWTPLHCAASCNNQIMAKFLIEHGASVYARTSRDNEIPMEKCENDEEEDDDENYRTCLEYLLKVQNDLGMINDGLVYGLYDYDPDSFVDDELPFKDGDQLIVLRRGDDIENEWYWARHENTNKEGYIPRNYLGLYPRIRPNSIANKIS